MGSTPSIADLKQQDQEFSDYIQAATDNLKARAKPDQDKFAQMIVDFYGQNNWDQQNEGGGDYWDYRQAAEFSLTSINDTLQGIAHSIFEGDAPPDGTVIDDAEAVAKVAIELASFQALALSAATAVITNILGVFDTSVSTSFHSVSQSKSLAPGLMLHTWNYGDSFQNKKLFQQSIHHRERS